LNSLLSNSFWIKKHCLFKIQRKLGFPGIDKTDGGPLIEQARSAISIGLQAYWEIISEFLVWRLLAEIQHFYLLKKCLFRLDSWNIRQLKEEKERICYILGLNKPFKNHITVLLSYKKQINSLCMKNNFVCFQHLYVES